MGMAIGMRIGMWDQIWEKKSNVWLEGKEMGIGENKEEKCGKINFIPFKYLFKQYILIIFI